MYLFTIITTRLGLPPGLAAGACVVHDVRYGGMICAMPRVAKPKLPKKPHGRPCLYTPETADEIVRRLSTGETLTSIGNDPNMPDRTTIWTWEEKYPEFDRRLRAARLKQADSEFDQLKDLADQPLTARMTREELERRKMQIDARKFRTARLNRALYGDTKDVKLTGSQDEPLKIESAADITKLTPEEQEQLRALSRKMMQGKG